MYTCEPTCTHTRAHMYPYVVKINNEKKNECMNSDRHPKVRRLTPHCYKHSYADNLDNTEEMAKFLEDY